MKSHAAQAASPRSFILKAALRKRIYDAPRRRQPTNNKQRYTAASIAPSAPTNPLVAARRNTSESTAKRSPDIAPHHPLARVALFASASLIPTRHVGLKMTSYNAFHSQLTSIMEALTKAAVAEICELVDDSYAVLQLEISRSHKENEALRRKLELIETIIARGHRGHVAMLDYGGQEAFRALVDFPAGEFRGVPGGSRESAPFVSYQTPFKKKTKKKPQQRRL